MLTNADFKTRVTYVAKRVANVCGTTFRPKLVEVKLNGKPSYSIREKLVSKYSTILSAEGIARNKNSKSTHGCEVRR